MPNLKVLRKRVGLSLSEAGKAAGNKSKQYIYNLENDKCTIPLKDARKFSRMYRVPLKVIVREILNYKLRKSRINLVVERLEEGL